MGGAGGPTGSQEAVIVAHASDVSEGNSNEGNKTKNIEMSGSGFHGPDRTALTSPGDRLVVDFVCVCFFFLLRCWLMFWCTCMCVRVIDCGEFDSLPVLPQNI